MTLVDTGESTGTGGDAQSWGTQTYDYLVNAAAAHVSLSQIVRLGSDLLLSGASRLQAMGRLVDVSRPFAFRGRDQIRERST